MLKDLFQICVSKILFSLQLNGDVKREDIQIILLPFSEAIAFTQLAHSFLIRLLLPPSCSKSAPRPGQHFLFLFFHLLAATICSNSVQTFCSKIASINFSKTWFRDFLFQGFGSKIVPMISFKDSAQRCLSHTCFKDVANKFAFSRIFFKYFVLSSKTLFKYCVQLLFNDLVQRFCQQKQMNDFFQYLFGPCAVCSTSIRSKRRVWQHVVSALCTMCSPGL